MELSSIEGLLIAVYFLVPGFISIKVYSTLVATDDFDVSKSLLDALAYSVFNFAVTSAIPIYFFPNFAALLSAPILFAITSVLLVLIFPTIWPVLYIKFMKTRLGRKHFISLQSTPWDSVFSQRIPCWVIVHLRDGRKIGGWYGTRSWSSSYPQKWEIFIEQVWSIDKSGKFGKKVSRSKGMVIGGGEIIAVEMFEN